LDPRLKDIEALKNLLKEYDPNEMTLHQVSSRVNSAMNDSPDIILPVSGKTGNND